MLRVNELLALMHSWDGPRLGIVLANWADQGHAIGRTKACKDDCIDISTGEVREANRNLQKIIASSDAASFFTTLGGLTETFNTIAQTEMPSGASRAGSAAVEH